MVPPLVLRKGWLMLGSCMEIRGMQANTVSCTSIDLKVAHMENTTPLEIFPK